MKPDIAQEQPLKGMRILVADDEFLIAVAIEDYLTEAGADIVRATTLPAALDYAAGEALSAALLDYRLGRHTTEEVADALVSRGVPFLFYSGQDLPQATLARHPDVRVLIKPVAPAVFVEIIAAMAAH